MKKVFFLTALLCASVMSFAAIDWNSIDFLGDGAGGGTYSNKYKVAVGAGQSVDNIQKPGFAAEPGIYTTFPAGISSCSLGDGKYAIQGAGMILYLSAFTQKETEVTVVHGTGQCVFTVFYADGESSSSGKADPELSINESAVTLDAVTPETFQIVATRKGTGAISYSSNNPGIASVDDAGLVTAMGRGTARITVTVAEDENYEQAAISLLVTVNGPINWEALSWVTGSSDKFKVYAAEDQAVVSVQQPGFAAEAGIYCTFKAGISSCSLGDSKYAVQGAGIVLYLSAFTAQVTEVTVVDALGSYTFYVYNADGTATAISHVADGAKAIKMIENGQLIIVRDGVRYNVSGMRVK